MSDFLLLAALAPLSWAASNLVDNYLLSKKLSDAIAYDVLTILISSVFAVLIFVSVKVSVGFDAFFYGTLVGLAFSGLYVLYNIGMMKEEGMQVVSVIYTLPLYVALFSWLFLGEGLDAQNYLGIVLLCASAIMISYKTITRSNLSTSGLLVVFVFAIGSAMTRVVSKFALAGVDVWSYLFWFTVGEIIGAFLLLSHRPYRERLGNAIHSIGRGVWILVCTTTLLGFIGYLSFYSAISIGSVSIASGVSAWSPTVIWVYSLVVAKVRPGLLPAVRVRKSPYLKMGAVTLIIVGTLLLANLG